MLFCNVFVLLAQAATTGLKAGDLQRGQPHAANVRPCKDKEVGAKALALHVHVHCVQIEVWHLILGMTSRFCEADIMASCESMRKLLLLCLSVCFASFVATGLLLYAGFAGEQQLCKGGI